MLPSLDTEGIFIFSPARYLVISLEGDHQMAIIQMPDK